MGDSNTASGARFWAKTDGSEYHPLLGHSADVAAVFAQLVGEGSSGRRRLARASGVEEVGQLAQTLVYLAALHDLGKVNHGFQDKAGPWCNPDRAERWQVSGHVTPVLGTFTADREFKRLVAELLAPLPLDQPTALDAFLTAICHHGQPLDGPRRSLHPSRWRAIWAPDQGSGRDPIAHIRRLADFASAVSGIGEGLGAQTVPWNEDVSNLFAGLLTVADWLGSNERWFPFTPQADTDPEAYWKVASTRAREAVSAVGLHTAAPAFSSVGQRRYDELFPDVFPRFSPTELQRLTAEIVLPEPGSRLVIESDTGSGKTEATLALYSRLREEGRVDGLVFALPTRATATAMHERITDALARLAPDRRLPTVALAMGGRSQHQSSGGAGMEDARLYPDEVDRIGYRWASQNSKTFFGAEIVVGTIDQVLLAGLPVKHAHLRLGLLGRHLIVVDEIHSCDRYMNRILRTVIDFHTRGGGIAAFLSATLARRARMELGDLEDESTLEAAVETPYPSLSIQPRPYAVWQVHPAGTGRTPKEIEWDTTDDASGLSRAIELAEQGARVCILRNTVKDARRTVEVLSEQAEGLLWRPSGAVPHRPPYHSRYCAADREALDRAVLRDFGKHAGRDGPGSILVSTQVVEQSLDVDFDWMMLDLAPIDVLLQRIGRLHRHDRDGRAESVTTPRVAIHAPREMFKPRAGGFGPHGWGTVYESWLDLELSRGLVGQHDRIVIPEMNRALIEGVYHEEARSGFVDAHPEWSEAADHDEGVRTGREAHAHLAALDLSVSYPSQAPQFRRAKEENIRTRLGDDRIEVRLNEPVAAWYAPSQSSNSVALPLPKLVNAGVEDFLDVVAEGQSTPDDVSMYRVGETGVLTYGPDGWSFQPRP